MPAIALSLVDHRRDSAGMRYVYPVLSRRAGGVSIGVNLNVNNACNWACVYCQVEGLTRGGPPPVDLPLLRAELETMLSSIDDGSLAGTDARVVDVAFSGNGEPTSSADFPAAVDIVRETLVGRRLLPDVTLRLITNGSLMHRPVVQQGVRQIGEAGGEVWFKIDRGSVEATRAVNGVPQEPERMRRRLEICARLARTWVQTCWFGIDGVSPSRAERDDYCRVLAVVEAPVAGVHLYGLARPSQQKDAARLTRLGAGELDDFAAEITKKTGVRVVVNP